MEVNTSIQKNRKRTAFRYHNYYKRTGFYRFVLKNLFWLFLTIGILILFIVLIQSYLTDFDTLFKSILKGMDIVYVFIIFFISESILGLIPPDIFILWSKTLSHPYLAIALLSVLSYIGGINSYYIGRLIQKVPRIKSYLIKKEEKNYRQIKKWGSWIIIFAALFPLPFAIICIMSGMINFSIKRFLLITLTRIIRFFIFAAVLYEFIK